MTIYWLAFKHLNIGDRFTFPDSTEVLTKVSTRRYVDSQERRFETGAKTRVELVEGPS